MDCQDRFLELSASQNQWKDNEANFMAKTECRSIKDKDKKINAHSKKSNNIFKKFQIISKRRKFNSKNKESKNNHPTTCDAQTIVEEITILNKTKKIETVFLSTFTSVAFLIVFTYSFLQTLSLYLIFKLLNMRQVYFSDLYKWQSSCLHNKR